MDRGTQMCIYQSTRVISFIFHKLTMTFYERWVYFYQYNIRNNSLSKIEIIVDKLIIEKTERCEGGDCYPQTNN